MEQNNIVLLKFLPIHSSKTERNTAKFNYLYHIFFGKRYGIKILSITRAILN